MRSQFQQSSGAAGQVQNLSLADRCKPTSQDSALLCIDVSAVGIAKPVAIVALSQIVVVFNYSTRDVVGFVVTLSHFHLIPEGRRPPSPRSRFRFYQTSF